MIQPMSWIADISMGRNIWNLRVFEKRMREMGENILLDIVVQVHSGWTCLLNMEVGSFLGRSRWDFLFRKVLSHGPCVLGSAILPPGWFPIGTRHLCMYPVLVLVIPSCFRTVSTLHLNTSPCRYLSPCCPSPLFTCYIVTFHILLWSFSPHLILHWTSFGLTLSSLFSLE